MTHTQELILPVPSTSHSNEANQDGGCALTKSKSSNDPHFSAITQFHRTDAGNAELFAALYGNRVRYDHVGGRWLIWKGDWWSPDFENIVPLLAKEVARWRGQAAWTLDDQDERDIHFKWAIKSEHRSRLDAILKLAQSEHPISDSGRDWDADPMLVGVKNGIVNLKTGTLRRGKLSDRIMLHTDIAFDPRAECSRWHKFLNEIFGHDRELVNFIQQAVGYCLTGNISEQVLFLCYGTGANGKSTFLDVLRYVFGAYAYNLPFSAFELKARSSISSEIAALVGKRFVTAIETNESAELNEGRIKALTGSDPITARFLYREFFTFEPSGKFWLAFNHKPRVSDDSPGFWRRVRLIPFIQHFPEEKRDAGLVETLKAESAGILRWAIRGALKWQSEGLKVPTIVSQASETYRNESDPLKDFLEERCTVAPSAQTTAAAIREQYVKWAELNGERPLHRKALSQKLELRGFKKVRSGHDRTWTWLGVDVKG